jgi:hypothetical protein
MTNKFDKPKKWLIKRKLDFINKVHNSVGPMQFTQLVNRMLGSICRHMNGQEPIHGFHWQFLTAIANPPPPVTAVAPWSGQLPGYALGERGQNMRKICAKYAQP